MTGENETGINKVSDYVYGEFLKEVEKDKGTERYEDVDDDCIAIHLTLYTSPDRVRTLADLWGFELVPNTLHPRFTVYKEIDFHDGKGLLGGMTMNLISVMTDYVEVARDVQV